MLFEAVVADIGEDRYRAACEEAWRTAAGTGRCGGARTFPGAIEQVPHEFADAWWSGDATLSERLGMGLRLYAEMPCYANTIQLRAFYGEYGEDDRLRLWDAYRSWLACADDRLADPVAYSLWVDFFEDEATVLDAWQEVTRRDVAPWQRRTERVLQVAGPVPWPCKEEFFAQVIDDPRLHPAVFRALVGSAFDMTGRLGGSAREWLERLVLPADTPDLPALRARLRAP